MDKEQFYNEQIELLAARDAKSLVEKHYDENAQVIVITGNEPVVAHGSDEIFKLFNGYLTYVYRGFISTEKFVTTDDSIMFEATIETVDGPLKIYDSMLLQNGKILRHYSGAK